MPARAAPPVSVHGGDICASTRRMRRCSGVSLSPGMRLAVPSLEEPDPERERLAQIADQQRPQLAHRSQGDKLKDIVGLGLPHQLRHEVRPHIGIRVKQALVELSEREVAIPEKIGTPARVGQRFRRSWAQHVNNVQVGNYSGNVSCEALPESEMVTSLAGGIGWAPAV